MVSTSHANAQELFDRDVECVLRYACLSDLATANVACCARKPQLCMKHGGVRFKSLCAIACKYWVPFLQSSGVTCCILRQTLARSSVHLAALWEAAADLNHNSKFTTLGSCPMSQSCFKKTEHSDFLNSETQNTDHCCFQVLQEEAGLHSGAWWELALCAARLSGTLLLTTNFGKCPKASWANRASWIHALWNPSNADSSLCLVSHPCYLFSACIREFKNKCICMSQPLLVSLRLRPYPLQLSRFSVSLCVQSVSHHISHYVWHHQSCCWRYCQIGFWNCCSALNLLFALVCCFLLLFFALFCSRFALGWCSAALCYRPSWQTALTERA